MNFNSSKAKSRCWTMTAVCLCTRHLPSERFHSCRTKPVYRTTQYKFFRFWDNFGFTISTPIRCARFKMGLVKKHLR